MSTLSRIDLIGQNGNTGEHYDYLDKVKTMIKNQTNRMKLDDYQAWTRSTAIYPQDKADIYLSLGLASEAGEVAGKLKKFIRDGSIDLESFISELGDVLWYLTRLCDEFGTNVEELAYSNYRKLEDRKQRNVIKGSGDNR
jgi:NTP pyrophosphatase (non-canonical NTP hydrolase)